MARTSSPIPKKTFFAAVLLCAIAALATLAFILINGVNVPFADEWSYAPLVKSVESGQATFGSFWSPQNEHRMLIPRLEFSALAALTHWNSKVMMVAGWLFAVFAMLVLLSQFKRIYLRARPILWIAAVGTSAGALFSLVQMENWLWAFQFAFFFIQFAVIAGLIILCRSNIPLWLRLLAAAALGVAASFSSAQGLFIWPALVLSLSLTNDSFRRKAIGSICLLVVATITFSLYFAGLPRTTELHLRPEQISEKAQLPIFGFLGLVGNPLAHWISYERLPHRAWFIGLSLTIAFVFLTWIVLTRRRHSIAAPWLGLGAYAYLFCLATTYGRLGMGYTGGFLAGRYTTHLTLLPIAILALLLIALDSTEADATPKNAPFRSFEMLTAFFVTFSITGLIVIGDFRSFQSGATEKQERLLARRLIPFASYFDQEVDGTMTGPFYPLCPLRCKMILDTGIKRLSDAGYFRRLDDIRFVNRAEQATGHYTNTEKIVEQKYLGVVQQGWKFSGAVSLGPKIVAQLIFFRPAGSDAFIAATELRQATDHGYEVLHYEWEKFLSPFILPDPQTPLEMWIYNQQSNEFVQIHQRAE